MNNYSRYISVMHTEEILKTETQKWQNSETFVVVWREGVFSKLLCFEHQTFAC